MADVTFPPGALSLCLWTDGDASIAASLAIRGWMLPDTSTRRWKAILEEASSKGYVSHGPSGTRLKVPLDARHERLEKITGQLNRQWNAALLTLLQRSGALRIVSEERTVSGAELWVAEILRPAILSNGPDLGENLAPFLSIGEGESRAARTTAANLERALLNDDEGCYRTLLFDMVESTGSPWPCGRCSVCVTVGERPRTVPSRHTFHTAWAGNPWSRPCAITGGALVVTSQEPTFTRHLDRLVARLASVGIEQFVTTMDTLSALEQRVCEASIDLGFTLGLGGNVPLARVPTAVLVGGRIHESESVRVSCATMRSHFESYWREVPLVFVLFPDTRGADAALAQYLSSQALMAELELARRGGNA